MVRERVLLFARQVREEHVSERLVRKLVGECHWKELSRVLHGVLVDFPVERIVFFSYLKVTHYYLSTEEEVVESMKMVVLCLTIEF